MNFEEFLQPKNQTVGAETPPLQDAADDFEDTPPENDVPEELEVQKVAVEELATDKAILDQENENLKTRIKQLENILLAKEGELKAFGLLKEQHEALKVAFAAKQSELNAERAKEADTQERNPNALALLDRDFELPDRFPGETRDHVLEVIREARDRAESEGCIRRAQLLESVLVANQKNGTLERKRKELQKLFESNGNVINGNVLEKLKELGISHKKGEDYLLPSEIIKRTY